ncbi:M56 family metallopeptidase [Nonlabens mediterrranea]|uniref:M56 family metallopeptidase n=1 Tax=Nonlabens mediterrranea TaxID=1419947 RepID=A0ABS0A4F9_9FLAO|nr:M56 family metallopeptidase [Nonlabens mediterrranea]
MEHFLINSTACLLILWLFYKLLLENTSWHKWKRYYLILSIVTALTIPFIVVKTVIIPLDHNPVIDFTNTQVFSEMVTEQEFQFNWTVIFWSCYGIGVLIMSWRFVKNLKTFRVQEEDEVRTYSKYQLVLRNVLTVPHSFYQSIFVSHTEYTNAQIPSTVLEHEKAHLDQKHSLDILFMEILLILLWFNPLFYIMKYSIKLNHEFLADQAVIQKGIDTVTYQETLLHYTQNSHSKGLANTFNFPIIKKRFHIMKTNTSQTSLILRTLILIPILTLLVISCGKEETEFQETEELLEIEEVVDDNHKTEIIEIYEVLENLTPEHIEEYNRLALKHKNYMNENNNLIVFKDETQHMQTIFHSMSKEQQSSNEPWPYLGRDNDLKAGQIPPPPPPAPSAIEYINEHKDELNYYLREDQIPADIAIKIINEVGQASVEISPDDNGVMSIKILETDNNKGTLPPPPPPVKSKSVSEKEFTEYNEWAKKNNEQNRAAKLNNNHRYAIIKQKDFEKYRSIYGRMSTSQKSEAQPLPTLPPPPPPAKDKKQISIKEVEEYNWLLNRHKEFLKNEKRIVVFKEDTNRMIQLYTSMSVEQQSKNQAWHYLYKENREKAAEILPPPPAQ